MVVQVEVQLSTRKGDDGQSSFEIGVVECGLETQELPLLKERHVVIDDVVVDDEDDITVKRRPNTRNSVSASSVMVNMHQSILNVGSEADDEESEDGEPLPEMQESSLFDDLMTEQSIHRDRSLLVASNDSYRVGDNYDDSTTVAEQHHRCCAIVPVGSASVVGIDRPSPNSRLAAWFDRSRASLTNMSESFVDHVMCPVDSDANCGVEAYIKKHYPSAPLQVQLEWDILNLLSCTDKPTAEEEEQVWSEPLTRLFSAGEDYGRQSPEMETLATAAAHHFHTPPLSPTPDEAAMDEACQQRAQRIHKLMKRKKMRHQPQPRHRVWQVPRSMSMDDSMLLHKKVPSSKTTAVPSLLDSIFGAEQMDPQGFMDSIGKGLEPISSQSEDDSEEDGYDSDSDLFLLRHQQQMPGSTSTPATPTTKTTLPPPPTNPELLHLSLYNLVQDSLNYSWSLIWHREGSRRQKIEAWLERGTLLNDGATVVEPKIMWRCVENSGRQRFETPFSLRMLNACRILAVRDDGDASTETMPPRPWMARSSHCFVLRTVDNESYLLEASSEQQRNEICLRWKAVVARLATLAVLEDMVTLADEFFAPRTLYVG